MPSRSRGGSAPTLPRTRTELRRLRMQVARLDHLTRVQASALARTGSGRGEGAPGHPTGDATVARVLLELLEIRSAATRAHCERVGERCAGIAAELGCSAAVCERIRLAGLLHDLGKIGIPDGVLAKSGPLSARDWSTMRRHPELGAVALEPLPGLADVALAVRHHHEWFDGSTHGYPDRLQGDQIPLASRIIAVADALDAMTARGAARRVRSLSDAQERLAAGCGHQFDPEVVAAALRLVEAHSAARARTALRPVRGTDR